jgi:hypothetical protein
MIFASGIIFITGRIETKNQSMANIMMVYFPEVTLLLILSLLGGGTNALSSPLVNIPYREEQKCPEIAFFPNRIAIKIREIRRKSGIRNDGVQDVFRYRTW